MTNKLNILDLRYFIGCPCSITGVVEFPNGYTGTIEGIDNACNLVLTDYGFIESERVKPILRRFENLSRHEVEGLNKLWPLESIKRTTFDSIVLDARIIDYLTGLNVDVFGWIDQGLAIDAANNNKS
jgi:hypothetical protein